MRPIRRHYTSAHLGWPLKRIMICVSRISLCWSFSSRALLQSLESPPIYHGVPTASISMLEDHCLHLPLLQRHPQRSYERRWERRFVDFAMIISPSPHRRGPCCAGLPSVNYAVSFCGHNMCAAVLYLACQSGRSGWTPGQIQYVSFYLTWICGRRAIHFESYGQTRSLEGLCSHITIFHTSPIEVPISYVT